MKLSVEQKLVSEIAKRREAENQAKIMEHERDALEIQLVSKQDTLNDLMNEFETLEARRCATSPSRATQHVLS